MTITKSTMRQDAFARVYSLLSANIDSSIKVTNAYPKDNNTFPIVVINPIDIRNNNLSIGKSYPTTLELYIPIPKAHYKLNGDADDSSGNEKHGTLINSPPVDTGKINTCYNFNGSTQRITAPQQVIGVSTEFSTGCWVYPTGVGSGNDNHIIAFDFSYGGNKGMVLRRRAITKLVTTYLGNTSYLWTTTIQDNMWTHIFLTHSGTTSKLYINGILTETKNTKAYNDGTSGSGYIGSEYINYFQGKIDDVRVYNQAISSDAIMALYNSGDGTESVSSSVAYTPIVIRQYNAGARISIYTKNAKELDTIADSISNIFEQNSTDVDIHNMTVNDSKEEYTFVNNGTVRMKPILLTFNI